MFNLRIIYGNQRVLYYARSAIILCPDVPGRGAGPKKNSNWLKTAKSKWRHLPVYKIGILPKVLFEINRLTLKR